MNNDNPPTSDEIHNGGLALARKLCLEKKYSEAKKVLSEILKVCINDSETMIMMVEILIAENKLTQAKNGLIIFLYCIQIILVLFIILEFFIVIENNGKRRLRRMRNPLLFIIRIQIR